MQFTENIKAKFKEFGPTTWSIKNKTSIYLVILFVSLAGIYQFVTLPKEQFPDIVIPTIYVQTVYVGNSPKDIENLVTRPIEKQIKSITGAKIKKFTSKTPKPLLEINNIIRVHIFDLKMNLDELMDQNFERRVKHINFKL